MWELFEWVKKDGSRALGLKLAIASFLDQIFHVTVETALHA